MALEQSLTQVVILTHDNADFDALASLVAAARLYPAATAVLPGRLNRNVRQFLSLYADALPVVEARALPRLPVAKAVVVDTHSVGPVRGMGSDTRLLIIDHHPRPADLPPHAEFEGDTVGATSTLLVERLRAVGVELPALEASLLLLGIYEDTGSLTYEGTTPRDLEAARWLLEQGGKLDIVQQFLHAPLTAEQQAWLERLINESEVVRIQERAILMATLRLDHYIEELSALAQRLADLFEPDACFLLAEYAGNVQVIARSTTDAVDVGAIARQLHGGGHAKAAAALVERASLAEVRTRIEELLRVNVQPAVNVAQVMSHGVHTLSPNLTIAEASARMRRYGHEGFPVVEGGRLVGILTRSEIDRALHHDLGTAPVRAYMRAGAISVTPSDPISRVQQIMMDYALGQVPVVADGRVLGIVTRTDLIKLWGQAPRPARQAQIATLLDQHLPPEFAAFLHQARDAANDLGYSLYVVGGFVRDLLLGQPTLDVDLVVEGDAIAVAQRLAAKLGGRVRTHGRFGTAKVILDETRPSVLPASFDLVTARTEFYTHPTALPQVERSSIKQDLYRRDFTINTMAICLDRNRYGELLDFYGGERDLRDGLIRVLHSLSFVEDPTRILRAVRFEQRLGFRLEERTEELLRTALELLDRVSGDRVRHELYLILREQAPERAWQRMHDLGVLAQISPGLVADEWTSSKLHEMATCVAGWRGAPTTGEGAAGSAWPEVAGGRIPIELPSLALLTMRIEQAALRRVMERLTMPRPQAEVLEQAHQLWRLLPQLGQELSGSALAALLRPFGEGALFAAWVAADERLAREQIELYQCRLRRVRPVVDGRRLRELGLKPGPAFGRVLDALRDARLDGIVNTPAEEEALLRQLIVAMGQGSSN
ncbi:MAG: CBS domain-containing protein [Anaerolineae bacterium]